MNPHLQTGGEPADVSLVCPASFGRTSAVPFVSASESLLEDPRLSASRLPQRAVDRRSMPVCCCAASNPERHPARKSCHVEGRGWAVVNGSANWGTSVGRGWTGVDGSASWGTSVGRGWAGVDGSASWGTSVGRGWAGVDGSANWGTSVGRGWTGVDGSASWGTSVGRGWAGVDGSASWGTSVGRGWAGVHGSASWGTSVGRGWASVDGSASWGTSAGRGSIGGHLGCRNCLILGRRKGAGKEAVWREVQVRVQWASMARGCLGLGSRMPLGALGAVLELANAWVGQLGRAPRAPETGYVGLS